MTSCIHKVSTQEVLAIYIIYGYGMDRHDTDRYSRVTSNVEVRF